MGAVNRAGHSRARWRVHVAVLYGAAFACRDNRAPSVERIEPRIGLADRATPVALIGRDLDPALEEQGPRLVAPPWRGTVGGRALVALRTVGPDRLEGLVPGGLPAGAHDVVLQSGDHMLRFPGAFVAVVPVAPRLDRAEPDRIARSGGVVVVRGAGLHVGSVVRVWGESAASRWIDDGALEIVAPPGPAGFAPILVETPVGEVGRTDLLLYRDD